MAKVKTKFLCQDCGYESVKWIGKCPGCGEWNSFVEERQATAPAPRRGLGGETSKILPIGDIPSQNEVRFSSGSSETNRVLGGGIVPGSLVLIGGDPGIGKSTLLLQLSYKVAEQGKTVLYISGEESASQLKLRAERLGTIHPNLYVLSETDMETALLLVEKQKPDLLIVDSIQTVYAPSITSAPGSVSQVRECTSMLLRTAKGQQIATMIVGHVTKEGNLAGPRLLEHMVDAVLYFEGERHHTYRVLRANKNRFGSTNELAIFNMQEQGLVEVLNPSEMFLSERSEQAPGSAVVTAMEGSRPLLLEVQALIAPTSFGTPRRMATGADYNRVSLILAVLEKRVGLNLQASDAYVNLAGGVRVDEPAIDLGIAMAIAASHRDKTLSGSDVFMGEIGLTGEVRSITKLEGRIREAEKLGFERCIVPARSLSGTDFGQIQVIGVKTLREALDLAL
ncbi:DNA repair protein RadA [Alicyclobacillus sp. SO9]|uniref:DNA repair protein RadA n=1 Tax=Alicyclobacillus sp. SO9 TaxID=2665646 RepID=UPI0018E7ACB2|nr:DNA repair protein RadA [Alicyclobacillus sp. SO9]QQE81468.1 DNA repair protein RadA [Alicyclobacillus sp. SO9]